MNKRPMLWMLLLSFIACSEQENATLSVPTEKLVYGEEGGEQSIILNCDQSWQASVLGDWVYVDAKSGSAGESTLTVGALKNNSGAERSGWVIISASGAPDDSIAVLQSSSLYPNYNISPVEPDSVGMLHDAEELAARMKLGWNMGNSLEALGGETGWGNPRITPELIQLVKDNGFNAIRLPCSFNEHLSDESYAKIDEEWLARVKAVVGNIVDEDMYVMLNIHWDGGWLEENCTEDMLELNVAKQRAYWQQIATALRDYDEHLLFAGCNEPNADVASEIAVLQQYHQAFVDAVRETGGKNAYRTLVVQGPCTDIQLSYDEYDDLPIDTVPDRMMLEIHYYTPWNFCGLSEDVSWGSMFYYWGAEYHSTTDAGRNATWGEEDAADQLFALMKEKYADEGIPVILGEYSASRRSHLEGEHLQLHLASRAYYFYYITKVALENGCIPFYWDNGVTEDMGCAIFDRLTKTVFDQQALDGLLQAKAEVYNSK